MPNAETSFHRWMRCLILFFILFVGYVIIADRYAPLTTESRVHGHVIQIAPEVSGTVTDVMIHNNQVVKQGQPLFSIDDRKYKLAVQQAEIALKQAQQQEQALYAQAEAATANITTSQANYNNAHSDYLRIKQLAQKQLVSASMRDNAYAKNQSAQANLLASQQQALAIKAKLGQHTNESTAVLAAKNALAQAKLNLSYTQIVAPSDGVITNLQLDIGTMATANHPLMTFIPTDSMWVAADFREKATANIDKNTMAYVTYDALPGNVFKFTIANRDFGVAAGQQVANGQLSTVEVNNRWVRDAQRIRVNLQSQQPLPPQLFVGSRASVVIYPDNNIFWKTLAKIEIHLASYLHFIY